MGTRLRSQTSARIHLTLTIGWGLAVIPTLLWWRHSILWVAFMSLWANVGTHWGAYQGARAETAARENGN